MKTKHQKGYWNIKKNVIEESKKFNTRTEFKKNSGNAYNSAREHKWLDEMEWLSNKNDKHPKGYWKIKENIMNEAKKYSSNSEFKENNLTAFLSAYKYGYMREMTWIHKKKKRHTNGWWTYNRIEQEALKYNTKTEFFKGNQTAYKKALKLGIIDDFFINNYVEY